MKVQKKLKASNIKSQKWRFKTWDIKIQTQQNNRYGEKYAPKNMFLGLSRTVCFLLRKKFKKSI